MFMATGSANNIFISCLVLDRVTAKKRTLFRRRIYTMSATDSRGQLRNLGPEKGRIATALKVETQKRLRIRHAHI